MSQVIPGYPANMCRDIPSYPILYQVILRRDIPGYPRISQDKIPVLGYPITSFLFWVIPGYPWINTKSGYPGISRDNPSCRFSRWEHASEIMFQNMIPCSVTWCHVQHQKPWSEHDFMFQNMIHVLKHRACFRNMISCSGTWNHVSEHEIMFQNMKSC